MSKTKERIRESNLRYRQSLGQNFIYDDNLLAALTEAAGVSDTEDVLEIGPGCGSLTRHLCRAANSVLSVELDERLIPLLQAFLAEERNWNVVQGDIMTVNLPEITAGLRAPFAVVANIPFYHHYAAKISETQHYFKEFIKSMYGKKLSKNILAILVPDDTTALESIFINELFLNSDACKAVAQMKMGQALSKTDESYVSISKSGRNLALLYVKNNEVIVSRYYDANGYDPAVVKADAARLHIDIEYKQVPVYVNNFNMNMDEFLDMGTVISPKDFMEKIAAVDVAKL